MWKEEKRGEREKESKREGEETMCWHVHRIHVKAFALFAPFKSTMRMHIFISHIWRYTRALNAKIEALRKQSHSRDYKILYFFNMSRKMRHECNQTRGNKI